MEIVDIGKGKSRITVRSKSRRDRLKLIDGVIVRGDRVYFPSWMARAIRDIVTRRRRRKDRAEQINWVELVEKGAAING